MSNTVSELIILAAEFEKMATQSLVKEAAKKDSKDKKKGKKPPFWIKNKDPKSDSKSDSKKDSKEPKKDSKSKDSKKS